MPEIRALPWSWTQFYSKIGSITRLWFTDPETMLLAKIEAAMKAGRRYPQSDEIRLS